jgi:NAD(P)-dependent dehydrogenase (short-subunit alcohol dehydrogenase family)
MGTAGSDGDVSTREEGASARSKVEGRTAFITGGAQGIGLGIALAFIKAGARIALADLDEEALANAKAQLQLLGDVETYVLDVRDREAYADVAEQVRSRLGKVTLLFNNAGVSGGAHVKRMTYPVWDWVMGVNVTGVINGLQTFLPAMLEDESGGHIVNTASGAGLIVGGSGVMYHASKYAVVGLSEALALELKPFGVGVSVLCPGPVATNNLETTRRYQPRPDGGAKKTEEKQAQVEKLDRFKKLLAEGVSPIDVGEMVLRAVRADQLHIFTDDILASRLEARHRQLMAAIPA